MHMHSASHSAAGLHPTLLNNRQVTPSPISHLTLCVLLPVCVPAAVKVKKANCGTPVAGLGRKMAL
jgi:hypothetical protein